ncbi:hypothetical protein J2850_005530 [Azospirillum picis]|uniref:Uncharacterized protein n=1 Tax=Azospirillum picis TaxID=488438 RepID=A0ABU0MTK4_9PROT|nr:hypothetical protein [Azospirillum picis]MDQ0536549.1 hypothetical protein [Azospirillum picis]
MANRHRLIGDDAYADAIPDLHQGRGYLYFPSPPAMD